MLIELFDAAFVEICERSPALPQPATHMSSRQEMGLYGERAIARFDERGDKAIQIRRSRCTPKQP